MPRNIAVYPGSFDPVTNGHADIIQRSCKLFDKVIVAVARNREKDALFTVAERLEMLRGSFDGLSNLEFDSFEGLLVDYTTRVKANVAVRGLRAITDFEYEMQMALMNRRLRKQLTIIFMMPTEEHIYISSTLVKEIASHRGPLRGLVPPFVEERLREKFPPV